jgi:Holliday junction resolvasome RuvABC DNA-binding subunit
VPAGASRAFDLDAIAVELQVRQPVRVRRAAETARRRRIEARSAERDAVAASREAARALVELGFSRRDAAEVLELSHQRFDQLLRS